MPLDNKSVVTRSPLEHNKNYLNHLSLYLLFAFPCVLNILNFLINYGINLRTDPKNYADLQVETNTIIF